jgi:hypothetical protein
VENTPANVIGIIPEKEVIYSPCTTKSSPTCAGDEAKVLITTVAEDKENDVLTYAYTVSAGKIIGQGANVIWDLSGVEPGQYSINAGVNDGCGICGRTITKTIEVKTPRGITDMTLSRAEVCLVCPFTWPGGKEEVEQEKKEKMMVGVSVAADTRPDHVYYYVVSGGKIIGDGPKVMWDLREASPGEYTITVGSGKDGVIYGAIVSKKIIMKRMCGSCCMVPCECGTLSIFGPAKAAKSGDTLIFRSEVRGGPAVTYKWFVSGGTIVTDPTGSSIMVKIPDDWNGDNITATVELGGTNPACQCPTTASETVGIIK